MNFTIQARCSRYKHIQIVYNCKKLVYVWNLINLIHIVLRYEETRLYQMVSGSAQLIIEKSVSKHFRHFFCAALPAVVFV